jgi:succinyl-CoA synthetase beta subunit
MDRSYNGPVMVASPRGGMDIEAVAEETPDQIFKVPVDIDAGPTTEQAKALSQRLGFKDITGV